VGGIPHVQFDGITSSVGASSCAQTTSTYRGIINGRLGSSPESPVSIEGVHSIDGNTVTVDVTFTLVDPVTLVNPACHVVVQESNLGGEYHWVTRDYHTVNGGLVNQGDEVTISQSFTGSWNMEEITIAAFCQKMTHPEEVYNAFRVPMVQDFQIAYLPPVQSVPGGNGTAEFTGTLTNVGTDADVFTVDLNDGFGWPSEFMLEGEGGFHTTQSVVSLGVGESIGVYLNVTTDSDVRIGVGGLQCHSANTDHTGDVNARVFNGSPAIMFVDDDRNRADEVELETALNSSGLLYDSWDVFFEHAEHNPALVDLDGFDVVLWHQGWNWGPRFDEDAMNTIAAYMDAGGGFIMSAQQFLTYVTAPNDFVTDYLGISSWIDNVGAEWAYGQAGDPISDGLDFELGYPSGSLNKADHLEPTATASVVFESENGDNVGIRNETRGMRSVTFAFGTNAIVGGGSPEGLATTLSNAVGWLAQTSQDVDDVVPVNGLSAITGIEPNPFSLGAATTIRLNLSETAANGQPTLQLMDVTGRLVRDMSNQNFQVGLQTVTWDGLDSQGRPVEAGVYYLNFSTADNSGNARVVVIR